MGSPAGEARTCAETEHKQTAPRALALPGEIHFRALQLPRRPGISTPATPYCVCLLALSLCCWPWPLCPRSPL